MDDRLLLFLLIVHILCCLICALLTRLRVLRNTYLDVFIEFLIPVFGLVMLLIRSSSCRRAERQARELELARLKIDDNVQRSVLVDSDAESAQIVPLSEAFAVNDAGTQRSIMKEALFDMSTAVQIEKDDVQEKVVPLQEALLINDSHTRRELIMDVLYTNPSGYIPQLSQARENSDSEVVHYAVTALVEIQKKFDLQFQQIGREMEKKPDDESLLRRYQRLLEQYLSSGLLEGSRRDDQLLKYVEVLKKRLARNEESLSLWIKKADADMRLENLEDLRRDAESMIAFRPENEQGYLYLLKYHVLRQDAEGVKSVIRLTEQRKIYLSAEGRAELAFWRN
ncbi:MAG: hypothetical protein ACI4XW_00030 [Candidatus Spyradocola sp.]